MFLPLLAVLCLVILSSVVMLSLLTIKTQWFLYVPAQILMPAHSVDLRVFEVPRKKQRHFPEGQ